jgi:dTDP-4-dehydrorhamnose reductase
MLGTAFCRLLSSEHKIHATDSNVNICNIDDVFGMVKNIMPDYIINCAAYTNVDAAETEREAAWALNVQGAENIALAAGRYGSKAVHFSTDYIFDGAQASYAEIDSPKARPLNWYGWSKLNGEEKFCQLTDDCFIIRTSWIFSEHRNNFVKTMLRLFGEKDEIKVINDQMGRPTYAPYLAERTTQLLFDDERPTGIWHVANSGITSWYKFATEIYRIGREIGLVTREVDIVPVTTAEFEPKRAAIRPKFSVLETKRVERHTEVASVFWKKSLRDCLLAIQKGNAK